MVAILHSPLSLAVLQESTGAAVDLSRVDFSWVDLSQVDRRLVLSGLVLSGLVFGALRTMDFVRNLIMTGVRGLDNEGG